MNQQSEFQLINTMLKNPAITERVIEIVKVTDFTDLDAQEIFRAIVSEFAAGRTDDQIRLAVKAMRKMRPTLLKIRREGVNSEYIELSRAINEEASEKALRFLCQSILDDKHLSAEQIATALSSGIDGLESTSKTSSSYMQDIFLQVFEEMTTYQEKSNFFESKFSALNEIWKPRRTELCVLAARPAIGKSALMMSLSDSYAEQGYHGIVFSLEMDKRGLMRRQISARTGIDSDRLVYVNDANDLQKVGEAAHHPAQKSVIINDKSCVTIDDICLETVRVHRKRKVDFIIIDYFQIIAVSGKSGTRDAELGQVSAKLKRVAKELDICVILLSQVNREAEGNVPKLNNLRECGALELDADSIVFLHRCRNKQQEYSDKIKQGQYPDALDLSVIVAKNRSGGTGLVTLGFRPNCMGLESKEWKQF